MVRRRLAAAGAAAGDALATTASAVEDLHRAIAGRAFGATPVSAPVRVVHDGVAGLTYSAVRLGLRAAGRVVGVALAVSPLAADPRLASPGAEAVQGALSGAFGDHLERRHPALAVPMAVRQEGSDVACTPGALAAAFPTASPRLAVFLHGLCETETAWGRAALDDGSPGTYGDHLHRRLGHSPVFVRFNSGLHISDNGSRLAALLDALVAAWPAPVEELALIGHSVGGLVIRSACAAGEREGRAWVPRVRHCVYLGTPHDGAPLEQATHVVSGGLRRLGETRPLARLLATRSAGVKDLRFAYLREEDWSGQDPDAGGLVDTGADLPLLAGARHHAVAATLGERPAAPVSRLLGDLLVLPGSALGQGRRGRSLPIEAASRLHIGGVTHFHLLDHAAIREQLHRWLDGPDGSAEVSHPR